MAATAKLHFLEDRWDEAVAAKLDAPELLRYRSNLLGSDLRITNFGGGNTSSKLDQIDPLDGQTKKVLWVKGSGGDLGSIKRSGFATLYLDKLLALEKATRAWSAKTRWWRCIRCARLGTILWRLRSIRRCMGFCRFRMWTICIRTGGLRWRLRRTARSRWRSSTSEFGHKLAWLPWQRPGFELGMMLKRGSWQRRRAATAWCWAGMGCLRGGRRSARAI